MAGPACLISQDADNSTTLGSDGGIYNARGVSNAIVSVTQQGDGVIRYTDNGGLPTDINYCDVVDQCGFYDDFNFTNQVYLDGTTTILGGSITIPETGTYNVRQAASFSAPEDAEFQIEILINGVGTGGQLLNQLGPNGWQGGDTIPFPLTAGTVLTMQVSAFGGDLVSNIVGMIVSRSRGV